MLRHFGFAIWLLLSLSASADQTQIPDYREVINESDSVLTTQLTRSRDSDVDIALMKYDSKLSESDLASREEGICLEYNPAEWMLPAPMM